MASIVFDRDRVVCISQNTTSSNAWSTSGSIVTQTFPRYRMIPAYARHCENSLRKPEKSPMRARFRSDVPLFDAKVLEEMHKQAAGRNRSLSRAVLQVPGPAGPGAMHKEDTRCTDVLQRITAAWSGIVYLTGPGGGLPHFRYSMHADPHIRPHCLTRSSPFLNSGAVRVDIRSPSLGAAAGPL